MRCYMSPYIYRELRLKSVVVSLYSYKRVYRTVRTSTLHFLLLLYGAVTVQLRCVTVYRTVAVTVYCALFTVTVLVQYEYGTRRVPCEHRTKYSTVQGQIATSRYMVLSLPRNSHFSMSPKKRTEGFIQDGSICYQILYGTRYQT